MVVAVTAPVLQRTQRRLKRVFACNIPGVAYVLDNKVKDRTQLAHVVARFATVGDEQTDLTHQRVLHTTLWRINQFAQQLNSGSEARAGPYVMCS